MPFNSVLLSRHRSSKWPFPLNLLSIHFGRLASMLYAYLAFEFITLICTADCINEVKEA